MTHLFKFLFFAVRSLLALVVFILDHIAGFISGAFLGLGKGLSGLFGMGLRSFGVGLIKKM